MNVPSAAAPAPYAAYSVPGNLADRLFRQQFEVMALFASLSETQAAFRYAPDKWSFKQLLGHLTDCERIMSYRSLSFARGEQQPLPGFEEDDYVAAAQFDAASLDDLLEDYRVQRAATLRLLRSFSTEMLERNGTANNRTLQVKQVLELIVNHERHHLQMMQERYLPLLPA